MSAPIGNVVQCGVYMLTTSGFIFPLMCSGSTTTVTFPNDRDGAYIVYPGFKVYLQDSNKFCDNTNGTIPLYYNSGFTIDSTSNIKVYYRNVEIVRTTAAATDPP